MQHCCPALRAACLIHSQASVYHVQQLKLCVCSGCRTVGTAACLFRRTIPAGPSFSSQFCLTVNNERKHLYISQQWLVTKRRQWVDMLCRSLSTGMDPSQSAVWNATLHIGSRAKQMRMLSSRANATVAMITYGLWQWKLTVQDCTGRLSRIILPMPRSSMVLATSWIQMPC